MFNKYLCVILLLNGVLSDGPDECVRYYFKDYDDLFTKDHGCASSDVLWNLQSYNNSTIVSAPNEKSELFIETSYSGTLWSCASSFSFTITPGGIVEANVYMKTDASVHFNLYLKQIIATGIQINLARISVVNPATGWQVVRVTNTTAFSGNPPFRGFITFDGRASENSDIIVDSFRYVPPSMNPDTECILYEDLTTTSTMTTTTPTTTTTIAATTTTTEPATTPDTTPTPPIIIPPNNLTNYFVEELINFKKSIRILKKRITRVVNNAAEQPSLELEEFGTAS